MKIVVGGAAGYEQVPGLESVADRYDIAFAPDDGSLGAHLAEAEVFVSWTYAGSSLEKHWSCAKNLKWVHWCGAGVKPVLFGDFVASDVVLTNARGIFDQAMAEYVLGVMLAFATGLPGMLEEQRARRWTYRQSELVHGSRAVIFGVGSIGRRIARLLQSAGVSVTGVGRTARPASPVFGHVLAGEDRLAALAQADWVIAVMPETSETKGYFGVEAFAAMRPSARFINVGRGNSVDEAALLAALLENRIAGAALDVFGEEPLPQASPLWSAPNLIVTPHVSGDFKGFEAAVCSQFLDNLDRYSAGKGLLNVVDKRAGYVTAG
ncbi:MAG: D-2-hydroxyacid dehydrogenase [Parvibaculaceae bacterium]